MRKPDKREHLNLFFSAFLIIAFIVCANFFSAFTATLDSVLGQLISILVYTVFGLLLFYATRVSDGKAVKRFSPITLIVLVIPTLFIIVASLAPFMPLHGVFAANSASGTLSAITALSAVALGYGIPYTFLSGFETAAEDETETSEVLEGGVEADLTDAQIQEEESAKEELDEAALQNDADDEEAEEKEESGANEELDEGDIEEEQ